MIWSQLITMATEETIVSGPWYSSPGFIALMGTLFGGAGLKVIEKFMSRTAEKREVGRDYRGEIGELVNRMDKLEEEVTFWRRRFYEEQEANALLRIAMIQGGLTPPTQVAMPPSTPEAPTH